jgi:DNA-binding MarR family transcriptional regulator
LSQDTFAKDRNADAIDAIVAQWRRERPDLDPSAKEITGRVLRLSSLFQQAYAKQAFGPLGLTDGSYGVLVALRRSGAPFELTPTELARHRMMSSGGMTLVVDRLERDGLVERSPNPQDRRGSLVRLTKAGKEAVDRAMERHAAAEQALVEGLSERDREQLAKLLRKLVLAVDATP